MGGILDGMPSLVSIELDRIQAELDRRAPGRNPDTSPRREADRVEILSGISSDGLTLGTPIGFIIRNTDCRSEDYRGYAMKFRPNHADYTYLSKYGIHAFAGGGRASARETVSWVCGGAICRQWLDQFGIRVQAHYVETLPVADARQNADSVGGIVEGEITGLPVGVGEPVFDKLHARLAGAMMSINAAKGFEYGDGFRAASMTGSESADIMKAGEKGVTEFLSNHSGGVQGGISNGMAVNFRVAFKPTPTFPRSLPSVDARGGDVTIEPRGRHDPCVAIRAASVVEAMAILTIGDLLRIGNFFPGMNLPR